MHWSASVVMQKKSRRRIVAAMNDDVFSASIALRDEWDKFYSCCKARRMRNMIIG